MNEKQQEHFKQILLDWREQLMQEVDRTVNHMQDDAANYPDPADRATQEEEFSLESVSYTHLTLPTILRV